MNTQFAHQILDSFRPLLEVNIRHCEQVGRTIPIPTFDQQIVNQILDMALNVFEKQEILLHLEAPLYVIGDIHGNIFDLVRIFAYTGLPPHSKFLFLGDYVDRGEYSVQVVMLLFSLMICYPDNVFLLRGNHEFEAMNFIYGFYNEIIQEFGGRNLYDKFNDTFQYMPLVALINERIFCVHGGISPNMSNIKQIYKIKRPLVSYEGEIVADLVWSDPCYDMKSFNESNRGLGVQFGVEALKNFLQKMEKDKLIRAHQCVMQGVNIFGDGLLYTVFSSSNYADAKDNKCGLLFIEPKLNIQIFSLPMMLQIPREQALLKHISNFEPISMTAKDSLALHLTANEIVIRSKSGNLRNKKMKSRSLILHNYNTNSPFNEFNTVRLTKTRSMDLQNNHFPPLG